MSEDIAKALDESRWILLKMAEQDAAVEEQMLRSRQLLEESEQALRGLPLETAPWLSITASHTTVGEQRVLC